MLSVKFWGTRGSIPCPGPETVLYGGNTTCLEIRADERLIIIDLGTGVRALGKSLIANDLKKFGKIEADIFVTHTHWDHIMGFPLFGPAYISGTKLRITGPVTFETNTLEDIIKNQLSYSYWPVRLDELAADISFKQINETTLDLGGGLTVTSKFLNHPISCLGYRFNYKGKSIATVFDHEPYYNLFASDPSSAKEGEITAAEENEKIVRFIQGADIVIHDSQYGEEEYKRFVGWGHASCSHSVEYAQKANVKKLVLFHHDPNHTDEQLEQLEKIYVDSSKSVEVISAKDGLSVSA